MKVNKIYIYGALMAVAAHLLWSCGPDRPEETKPDFALSARVQSLDYNGSSIWGNQAELGVFVTKPGSTSITEGNENKRYTTIFQTKATRLSAVEEKISLPENGGLADIHIYYPYYKEITLTDNSKAVYNVDLKNQEERMPEMLLAGKQENCSATINSATVSLKPVFSKLNVRVKNEHTTKSSAEDIRLQLTGIPCKAEIDILTTTYQAYGELESTEMTRPENSIYAYEAILLAHEVSEDARLKVIFPESSSIKEQEISLAEHIAKFDQNCQYDMAITVTDGGINAVLISISDFSVSEWYEDSEDIFGNINN